MTALCGCAANPDKRAAPAAIAVNASALVTCEAILKTVPLADVKAGDDALGAFLKADAATITANDRIATGRRCVAEVRKRYAAPK